MNIQKIIKIRRLVKLLIFKSPFLVFKNLRQLFFIFKTHGFFAAKRFFLRKIHALMDQGCNYEQWFKQFELPTAKNISEFSHRLQSFSHTPLISIVMATYNTKSIYLIAAIESILNQIYPHWELCIVDDASSASHVIDILKKYQQKDKRIKVHFSEINQNVSLATNKAIAMATGNYIAFMDHDDEILPHSLFMVVQYINKYPQAKLLFSDEDILLENGQLLHPAFKPGWNPFLLENCNYICHFCVLETKFLQHLGGLRAGFEGSQDHDLVLRATEQLSSEQIVHIPYILYHWRVVTHSLGKQKIASINGVKAVQEHFDRINVLVKVSSHQTLKSIYRISYILPTVVPKISIIIPTRDRVDLLKPCIESILAKTSHPNYEILIVDNDSVEAETLAYFSALEQYPNIKIITMRIPFNYSILNNKASELSSGEYLCFLNNDTEVISNSWLEEMVGIAARPNIAAVGAKLYYPDDTIQHVGVILGLGVGAGHILCGSAKEDLGYLYKLITTNNYCAVTAACLMIKREIFQKVNGFSPEFPSHFGDIDFCIRLFKLGYQNVFTPFAELYHYESASRSKNLDDSFQVAMQKMKELYGDLLDNDPYFHRAFSRFNLNMKLVDKVSMFT